MRLEKLQKFISSLLKPNPELESLKKFPLFRDFTKYELFLFNQLMHRREFKEGEVIYQEKFPLAAVFLVEKGIVELDELYCEKFYKTQIHRHQFFGIVDMYNEDNRKGSAVVLKDAQLLAISHLDFKTFIHTNPRTGVKLLNNICRTLSRNTYPIPGIQDKQ